MDSKNFEMNSLKWDTEYFGISSARVNLYGVADKQQQDKIIEFCNDYEFVTISNLDNKKENNYWIGNKTNAFLADMNIQFMKVLEDNSIQKSNDTYVLNKYPRDNQIIDIAKKTFLHSRFFNDPRLPQVKAKNVYLHWTECAFEQENKYFAICEKQGIVMGFILFTINSGSSVIELIAIDEEYQGQRVGSSLIQTMESFIIERRINKIKVGTQVNNIPAVKFYTKIGFKYVSCGSMYHLWRR